RYRYGTLRGLGVAERRGYGRVGSDGEGAGHPLPGASVTRPAGERAGRRGRDENDHFAFIERGRADRVVTAGAERNGTGTSAVGLDRQVAGVAARYVEVGCHGYVAVHREGASGALANAGVAGPTGEVARRGRGDQRDLFAVGDVMGTDRVV